MTNELYTPMFSDKWTTPGTVQQKIVKVSLWNNSGQHSNSSRPMITSTNVLHIVLWIPNRKISCWQKKAPSGDCFKTNVWENVCGGSSSVWNTNANMFIIICTLFCSITNLLKISPISFERKNRAYLELSNNINYNSTVKHGLTIHGRDNVLNFLKWQSLFNSRNNTLSTPYYEAWLGGVKGIHYTLHWWAPAC